MKRYRDGGLEAAVRYGCDLFGCQPAYCKAILKSLPLPLRVGIEKAVRLCFGGKKLFRAQFDLVANDYADHAAWHADWQARRAQEFALLGSKDETSGNQSCTASVGCTGAITLRLRLPG